MFDTVRNKLRGKHNAADSRTRGESEHSNIGRSTPNIPIIITSEDAAQSDGMQLSSSHSGLASPTNDTAARESFVSKDINRERRPSSVGTKSSNSVTSPRRNVFWKAGLWNSKHQSPSGPRVRAVSQSVDRPHPLVAEQQMRNLPHRDWQGRSSRDGIWDEANVAKLYG